LLGPLVDSLASRGVIHTTSVFTEILPPAREQHLNRTRWAGFFGAERRSLLRGTIQRAAAEHGLPAGPLLPYADSITDLSALPLLDREALPESFVDGVLGSYLCASDSGWYGAVPVVVAGDTSWSTVAEAARRAGAMAVNDDVLGDRVVEIVRAGFFDSLILLPIVMLLVLVLVLRDRRLVLASLVPPALATGLTLGGMAALGLPVTIVSFMVLAFVFGLGVDYAVFMAHMCRSGATAERAGKAGASVTVAALTTIAGLGMTVFARHPVLVSLGSTGLLGIVSSYLCAVVFVPVVLHRRTQVTRDVS
jgi:hypothetical protein